MDQNLKHELGNMVEVMLFQSGCTETTYCDPKNPDLDGYIVSHEKLERLVKLVVMECANALGATYWGGANYAADVYADGQIVWDHLKKEFAE